MNDVIAFALGILLTFGTGVFVAAEFSLVALDRHELERRRDSGERGLDRVINALRHTSTHLSSAQLGITLTTLLAGFLLEPVLSAWLDGPIGALGVPEALRRAISAPLAVAFATLFSMVVGELVPKNFALAKPLGTARFVVPMQAAFTAVFKPAVLVLNGSANGVLRSMGIEPKEELSGARTAEELSSLVRHSASAGLLEADTATLLDRTLRFSELTAADVMTPRLKVESVQRLEPAQAVLELAGRTGFSRFPVIDGDRDDVVGVVHVKQAVSVPREKRGEVPAAALAEEAMRVPETMRLDQLLGELRGSGYQLALVVDEYGGTAGIVTLEDLVEELVGEVADEHDRAQAGVVGTATELTFPADLRPDEVRDRTGIEIPEHDSYDTVAGYVLQQLERIPVVGDEVLLPEGGRLRVERMEGRRIARLRYFAPAPVTDTGSATDEGEARAMNDWLGILWLVLLLIANAFFVAAEFAVISARRSQIEPKAEAGSKRAKTALYAMEHATLMLATSQLGITVCSLLILNVSEPSIHHLLSGPLSWTGLSTEIVSVAAFVITLLVVSYLHVVFGEMIPKNAAFSMPDQAVLLLAPPLVWISRILRFVIAGLNATANGVLRLFKVEPKNESNSTFTLEEVANIVSHSTREGVLEDRSGALSAAFEFTTKQAKDILVPLDRLVSLPIGATTEDVEAAVTKHGFSRYPMRDADDALVGYVHIKDLLRLGADRIAEPIPPKRIRELLTMHPEAELEDVLARMQARGVHLAQIRDRDGLILGIVFLEDVIEELVGEVHDATRRQRFAD